MSTNIQYRLQQHEVIPPEEVWNKIALRLDDEYDQHDILLSQKLSDAEQAPPELWHLVLAGLNSTADKAEPVPASKPTPVAEPILQTEPALPGYGVSTSTDTDTGRRKARIIPFRLQRIAAVFALAVAVSALYYFLSENTGERAVAFTDMPAQNQAGLTPSLTLPRKSSEPPSVETQAAEPRRFAEKTIAQNSRRSRIPVITAAYNADETELADNSADLTYAAIDKADRIPRGERIAVPAQPIRDGAGNIILDEKLISAPDQNYITVTGPNGEQTKISKKFLHALSYMNSGSAGDDYMGVMLQEGSLWKWLFHEWRQKLLTQPSFIPSAANFLDIMELKEILHENL